MGSAFFSEIISEGGGTSRANQDGFGSAERALLRRKKRGEERGNPIIYAKKRRSHIIESFWLEVIKGKGERSGGVSHKGRREIVSHTVGRAASLSGTTVERKEKVGLYSCSFSFHDEGGEKI